MYVWPILSILSCLISVSYSQGKSIGEKIWIAYPTKCACHWFFIWIQTNQIHKNNVGVVIKYLGIVCLAVKSSHDSTFDIFNLCLISKRITSSAVDFHLRKYWQREHHCILEFWFCLQCELWQNCWGKEEGTRTY